MSDVRSSDIDDGFAPTRAPSAYTVELDGEAVLYDEVADRLHLLNHTATLLWTLFGRASRRVRVPSVPTVFFSRALTFHRTPWWPTSSPSLATSATKVFAWLGDGHHGAKLRWHRSWPHVSGGDVRLTVHVLPPDLDEPFALAGTGLELWALLAEPIIDDT